MNQTEVGLRFKELSICCHCTYFKLSCLASSCCPISHSSGLPPSLYLPAWQKCLRNCRCLGHPKRHKLPMFSYLNTASYCTWRVLLLRHQTEFSLQAFCLSVGKFVPVYWWFCCSSMKGPNIFPYSCCSYVLTRSTGSSLWEDLGLACTTA